MTDNNDKKYPFYDFQPRLWDAPDPEGEGGVRPIYSITRNHGVKGQYQLHNPNDEINREKSLLDRVVVEYKIGNNSYDIFTVGDFFEASYAFEEKALGNIMGDIAERIARRIVKYFLQHYSKDGTTGGIFDARFNPAKRNDYIVANTDRYILKIEKYPNLVILKNTGDGNFGYESIKELDGLFDYRYKKVRHILVLESKIDKININSRQLVNSLFVPLRRFFPNAEFSYILFSDEASIFRQKGAGKFRELKHRPLKIFRDLQLYDIGLLNFTFNETHEDFEKMAAHIITEYKTISRQDVEIWGKMVLSGRKIILYDRGESPRIKLIKDVRSGLWREVKFPGNIDIS